MTLRRAALLAEFVAAIVAILLARRRAEHKSAAIALSVFAVVDSSLAPIDAALTPWPAEPWTGFSNLVLVHTNRTLSLALECVLPTLALSVCVENKKRAVGAMVAAWTLASVTLAALYPSSITYSAGLARVYLAADLLGLSITLVSFVHWARLHKTPTSAHGVVILLACGDCAILLVPYSPWREGIFRGYDMAQLSLTLLFSTLAIYQGRLLWRSSAR